MNIQTFFDDLFHPHSRRERTEGILKDNRYFQLGSQNFAGRCIIATETDDGGTTDCNLTIEQVAEKLEWLPEGHKEEPFMSFVKID